jgi:sarcosine oxidase subunit beta
VDVVIIGAGVIGAATAFELAKRGYRTLNVDKLGGAGLGSTVNSCALIRTHYSTFDGCALAHEASLYWRNWGRYLGAVDELGLARFITSGCVIIKPEGFDFERLFRHYDELGIAYERWDLDTLAARMPIYDRRSFWPPRRPEDEAFFDEPTGEIPGAIFTPGAGYISDPQLATHNLQRAAEARGGRFLFNREVVEIRRAGGRVAGVTLDDGERIDAPVVVNVAGPHSGLVNRLAGIGDDMSIRTRPLRHEVHVAPSPEGFDFARDGCVTTDDDTGAYCRPEVGNTLLFGSTDPACDPKEWVEDPDNFNREVTEAQWKAQIYRLARRIPSLGIPSRPKGVVDLYDVADDWMPIYDRSRLPGFYLAIGTSGNQFKNAPIVGHLMAELITACERGQDHDSEPVRFKCPHTGVTLNAGFYSRRREVNPESSFSVMG